MGEPDSYPRLAQVSRNPSLLPPRTAETIAREAGVKVVEGADALYGDSLGPAGSDGDTFLKMIRHNTRTIVSNLSAA